MSENNEAASSGLNFTSLLTIVFITLKLTHYIDWSWYLVLLPLYGPLALLGVICVVVLILIFFCLVLEAICK